MSHSMMRPGRRLGPAASLLLAVCAGAVSAQPAPPYAQTRIFRRGDAGFGAAVAVCSGGRVAIGAPGATAGAGSVAVFASDGSALWTVDDPNGSPGDRFGAAVACAGSGAILVGAPGVQIAGLAAGAAYLIDVDAMSPTAGTVRQRFVAPDPHDGDGFGTAVAADATHFIVGAPFADDGGEDAGAVFLFDAGHPTDPLAIDGAPATAGDYFGFALALAGNQLLVGVPFDSAAVASGGAAHLLTLGGTPVAVTARRVLRAASPVAGAELGTAVAFDGATAVAGAPFELRGSGAAYVFDPDGTIRAVLHRPTRVPQDGFGAAVAVSAAVVAVGAPGPATGEPGAVSVFDAASGTFVAQLPDPMARAGDRFAAAVAVAADTVLAGAPGDDRSVRVFSPCGGLCMGGCGNGIVEPVPTTPHVAADACPDAVAIAALPFRDVIDVGDATASPGDPAHPACASGVDTGSVWYHVTPPADGLLTIDARASDYAATVAVYTGGCATPVVQDCGDVVTTAVQAGVDYLVEVVGGTGRLDLFVGSAGTMPEACDDGDSVAGDGCDPGCIRSTTSTTTSTTFPTTTTTTTTTTTSPTTTTITTTTTSTFAGSTTTTTTIVTSSTTSVTSTTTTSTSTSTSSTTTTTLPGACSDDADCSAAGACRDAGLCRVCNGCDLVAWPCCGRPRRCAPGVAHPDGETCDDDDACTTADVCAGGTCAGTPRTCAAPGPCELADTCDPGSGTCVATPRPDGDPCDDGNPCVTDRTCAAGVCQGGSAVQCPDDGVACTVESCSAPTGCVSVEVGCACDVDADCTGGDPCRVPHCVGHACVQTPVDDGTGCPAASPCLAAGTCRDGACAPGATIHCDDGDPCTADAACDPTDGCTARPLDCFDGVACRLTRWQTTAACDGEALPTPLRGALERARRVVLKASSIAPRRARAALQRAGRTIGQAIVTSGGGAVSKPCATALRADLREARTRLRALVGARLRDCLGR